MNVSIKAAVKEALAWVQEQVPNIENLRLEQVDLDERDLRWEVVVSYTEESDNPFGPKGGRTFKLVVVDREDGEVLSFRPWGM